MKNNQKQIQEEIVNILDKFCAEVVKRFQSEPSIEFDVAYFKTIKDLSALIESEKQKAVEQTLQEASSYNVAFCSKCKGLYKAVHEKCYKLSKAEEEQK